MLGAVLAALRTSERNIVLLLDDLHWADDRLPVDRITRVTVLDPYFYTGAAGPRD